MVRQWANLSGQIDWPLPSRKTAGTRYIARLGVMSSLEFSSTEERLWWCLQKYLCGPKMLLITPLNSTICSHPLFSDKPMTSTPYIKRHSTIEILSISLITHTALFCGIVHAKSGVDLWIMVPPFSCKSYTVWLRTVLVLLRSSGYTVRLLESTLPRRYFLGLSNWQLVNQIKATKVLAVDIS